MHQNQKQLLSARPLPLDEPEAKKPMLTAIHAAMERGAVPRSQRLSYSLHHVGLHPLSVSGGLRAGAVAEPWGVREELSGLAGHTCTFHLRALSSLKVTFKTTEKTNISNSAKVCSSVTLTS